MALYVFEYSFEPLVAFDSLCEVIVQALTYEQKSRICWGHLFFTKDVSPEFVPSFDFLV